MSDLKIIPIDTAVIVQIEKIEEVSKGGIKLPEAKVERDQQSIVEGVLASVGDLAFCELIANNKSVPNIGDTVYFKRYSGILHEPKDKTGIYRIIQDIDIYAFSRKEVIANDNS